jgi:hypothetical protein
MALDPSDAAGLPDELIALYSDAELALIAALAEAIAEGIDTPEWEAAQPAQMLRFRRQAEALAAHLQAQMPALISTAVSEAAATGAAAADADLDEIPSAPPKPAQHGKAARTLNREREAWHTLATVTQRLPAVAGELYGQVVAQVQVRNHEAAPRTTPRTGALYGAPTPEGTRIDAAQQALDILTKRGITGFKDARGRNWSLSSYVEMKSRTIVNQELIDSHTDRMRERGQSLLVVSSHKHPSPQCQPFEGQVLSLGGETGTVIRPNATGGPPVKVRIKATLDEARRAGFQHPNCRHAVSAYIPGASRTFTTKPDLEGYEATQKQRALERALQDAKRKQAVAVTPAAKREATARVKALQAQLKAHVAANDLKRRPQRESITGEHRVEPAKGANGPEGPMTAGGGKGPTGPVDPPKPRTGGGGGDDGDGDDPYGFKSTPLAESVLRGQRPDRLTESEAGYIEGYASNGHKITNRALRGEIEMTPSIQARVDGIRSGLAKYPLPANVRVTREVDANVYGIVNAESIDHLIGDSFTERGFMSTSVRARPPHSTTRPDPAILELIVPKGTPALRLGALADIPDEAEALVIDGQRYRIVGGALDEQHLKQGRRVWRLQALVLGGELA